MGPDEIISMEESLKKKIAKDTIWASIQGHLTLSDPFQA